MSVFYRVLNSPDAYDRWCKGRYVSYHTTPNEWIATREKTGSPDPADYPLCCREGVYTAQARERFLSSVGGASSAGLPDGFAPHEVWEVDGVYAYRSAQDALDHARGTPWGEEALIVEFEGEVLGGALEAGGVLARVVRPRGNPKTASVFKKRYELT